MVIRASHWWAAFSVATTIHIFALLWLSQPTARVDPPMVSTGIVIALQDQLTQQREHTGPVPQPAESVSDIRGELAQPRDTFDAASSKPAKPAPPVSPPEPTRALVGGAAEAVSAPTSVVEEPPVNTITSPDVPAEASPASPQAVSAVAEDNQIIYEAKRVMSDVSTADPPAAVTSLQLEPIHPNIVTGKEAASMESVTAPQSMFDELTPAIDPSEMTGDDVASMESVTAPQSIFEKLTPAIDPSETTDDDAASIESVTAPRTKLDELAPVVPRGMKSVPERRAVVTEPLTPAEDVIARAAPPPISPVQQRLVRGVTAQYAGVLKGWLQRNMRYPRDAWLDGQQGTVIVLFTIGRHGNVLTSRLERSSGHKLLDREAMQMVERADPFPSMPPEIIGNELELRVPIVFYIKEYEKQREMPPIYLR